MAVRSGAGTGVVVALVVFVITTVFLLVMTIVFYKGQTEARENANDSQTVLARYIRPEQRGQDRFAAYESAAQSERASVVQYLEDRYEALMGWAHGRQNVSFEEFQAEVAAFGVDQDVSLLQVARQLQSQLSQRQTELDRAQERVRSRDQDLSELQDQLERARQDHDTSLAQVQDQVEEYRETVDEYGRQLQDAITQMEESVAFLESSKDAEIEDLENEKDQISRQLVVLQERIREFQEVFQRYRERAQNPATLVDGTVIDTAGADQVFIDRGRRDRIVLGMTFEVYRNAAAMTINDFTGEIPSGHASVQVIKVGETTATCAITRSSTGQPIGRGDVIANAVYDPDYDFKFLVHGIFDTDGDGRPTPAEADFLRSLVLEWGGRVVTGTQLPGDLDFLVLGVEPPEPAPLSPTANDVETRIWLERKRVRETYLELFNQAREAQIPVLNSNRFLVLIGYADR